ncbi:MAG: hypothetical protein V3T07_00735 [Myxococcota bacterium]
MSLLLCAAWSPAAADPVVGFDDLQLGNRVAANQDQSVGWEFDVDSPITVIGLSWYDAAFDGLNQDHRVGLWAPDGTLLRQVTVLTDSTLDGQFRTVFFTDDPLVLRPAGESESRGYIVGGENFTLNPDVTACGGDGASLCVSDLVLQTFDPRVDFMDATFSLLNEGFTRPTRVSGDPFGPTLTGGFYGPSFSVIIPQPSTGLLLAAGLIVLALARRHSTARHRLA